MRTTVTIDPDTAALLQEEIARTGLSFKQVLNGAIRKALGRPPETIVLEPVFQGPFPLDLSNFNRLADEWDDENTLLELNS